MFHFYTRISFTVGIILGVIVAVLYTDYKKNSLVIKTKVKETEPFKYVDYNSWFKARKLKRKQTLFDDLRYNNVNYTLESKYLYDKIKILCVILVRNENNYKAALNTWSKGCNEVRSVNFTNEKKRKLPQLKQNIRKPTTWALLCRMLFEVPDTFSWIVVVNDYTFVIVENLRYFIASLNFTKNYYLGHAISYWGTVYNFGQAGYVLSKGSLNSLKKKLNSADQCHNTLHYQNKEDYYLGKYMASLNITPSDTRDFGGYSTFHPNNWYHLFFPSEGTHKSSLYPVKCCSRNSITFQSIEGDKMYTYYYLLYTLQLFYDGRLGNKPIHHTMPDDSVWKQFLRERDIPLNVSSEEYYKLWVDLVDSPTSFAKNMKRESSFDYE